MVSSRKEIRNKAKDRTNLSKLLPLVESGDLANIYISSIDSSGEYAGSTIVVAKGAAIEVLKELGITTFSSETAQKKGLEDRGAVSKFAPDARVVDPFMGNKSLSAVLGTEGYDKLAGALNTKAELGGDKRAKLPVSGRTLP